SGDGITEIDAALPRGNVFQCQPRGEGLIAGFVPEVPVAEIVTYASYKTIRIFIHRRFDDIWVCAKEISPECRRTDVFERSRGDGRTITRGPVVLEIESQIVGGVHREVRRTEFTDSGEVVICEQAGYAGRMKLVIVAIKVVIALPIVRAE